MSDTYERVRAALCPEHGFGRRNEAGRWIARDDTQVLDEHAELVTRLVLSARELHAKTTERSTA